MARGVKLTQSEAESKLHSIHGSSIHMLEPYKALNRPIRLKCVCTHEWVAPLARLVNPTPNRPRPYSGCPACARARMDSGEPWKKDHEWYVKEVAKVHPRLKVISTYTGSLSPVTFKCLDCGTKSTKNQSYSAISGRGCPRCATDATVNGQRVSAKRRWKKWLRRKFKGRITLVRYRVLRRPRYAQFHCSACDHTWENDRHDFRRVRAWCPNCEPRSTSYIHQYTLPSGRIIELMGYERFAVDYLLGQGLQENEIVCAGPAKSRSPVPSFHYTYRGKQHTYYPDIDVKGGHIVEVKSTWTFLRDRRTFNRIKAKCLAVMNTNRFTLLVFNSDGTRVDIPRNWYEMRYTQLRNHIYGVEQ